MYQPGWPKREVTSPVDGCPQLGQRHRKRHPGHVEEERLKLVAGIQVLPGRRCGRRLEGGRGFCHREGDGLDLLHHGFHHRLCQGDQRLTVNHLRLELEWLDMHLFVAQGIHLELDLSHLGKQLAQLGQSGIGFKIGVAATSGTATV